MSCIPHFCGFIVRKLIIRRGLRNEWIGEACSSWGFSDAFKMLFVRDKQAFKISKLKFSGKRTQALETTGGSIRVICAAKPTLSFWLFPGCRLWFARLVWLIKSVRHANVFTTAERLLQAKYIALTSNRAPRESITKFLWMKSIPPKIVHWDIYSLVVPLNFGGKQKLHSFVKDKVESYLWPFQCSRFLPLKILTYPNNWHAHFVY